MYETQTLPSDLSYEDTRRIDRAVPVTVVSGTLSHGPSTRVHVQLFPANGRNDQLSVAVRSHGFSHRSSVR